MIAWLNISEGKPFQFLAFLACGSLLFVGEAAEFKQKLTDKVHYISAGICVASALTFITLVGYWYIPAVMLALYLGQAYLDKKIVLWIEIAALVATFTTLLWIENATLITSYFTRFIY